MIPKHPFASDLTPESELAEFERLKPRLKEVWDSISMRDESPHTSIVPPSFVSATLRHIAAGAFSRPPRQVPSGP